MRSKVIYLSFLFLIQAILPAGPGFSQTPADSVVARVGQKKIYLRKFQERLQARNLAKADQPLDLATKKNILNELIDEILVEKKAASYGFKDDPTLQDRIAEQRPSVVLEQVRQRLISDLVSVSEEEIQAHYQANRELGYKSPEAVKLRQIFISFEKSDSHSGFSASKKVEKESRQKCQELFRRLKAGADFGQLARTFSNHRSLLDGGEMGYIPRGEFPAEIEEIVFSAQPGLIDKPLKRAYGYHIIEIQEYQREHYQELTPTLQEGIAQTLRNQKEYTRKKLVLDSLRQKVTVKYNQKAIAKLSTPLGFENWLMIAGSDTLYYTQFLPGFQEYTRQRKINPDTTVARQYLERFADTLLLLAAARQMKLHQSAEVKEQVQKFRIDLAKQEILRQKSVALINPTPDEIKAYYQKNKSTWKEERPLCVQHIIFSDSSRAAQVREKIVGGLDFREAALKYYPGEVEIREVVYDLGFISPQEMPIVFYRAAEELQVDQVSQAVKTDFGWHLIKLVDRKEYKSLEEAENEIKGRLVEEKRRTALQDWEAKLRKGTKIWVNEKLLEEYSTSETEPKSNLGSTQPEKSK